MTQLARPIADEFTGQWMPVPVYAQINDVTNGPGVVSSSLNPQGDAFEVQLEGVAYPKPEQPQTVTVRLRKTSADDVSATIALLQGTRVIAFDTVQLTQSFDDYPLDLSQSQIDQITDYTDLRVRVIAGLIPVACCPNLLPPILHATLSNGSNCSCASGVITLTYGTVTPTGSCRPTGFVGWYGEGTWDCHPDITLALLLFCDLDFCSPGGWGLIVCSPFPACPVEDDTVTLCEDSHTCNPLQIVFTSAEGDLGFCGCPNVGAFKVTITK